MWEVEKAILYICNRSRNKGRATLSRGWSTYIESSSFSIIELHVLAACATTIAVSGNTITITNLHYIGIALILTTTWNHFVYVYACVLLLSIVFLFILKCFTHTRLLIYSLISRSHARSSFPPLL